MLLIDKKLLIGLLAATAVFGASAQGLDLRSRVIMKRNAFERAREMEGTQATEAVRKSSPEVSGNVMALVSLHDGYDISHLQAAGMAARPLRGGIYVVSVEADSVESKASLPCIKKFSIQEKVETKTNLSRKESGVDAIHAGEGLDVPYTGKNVLTGIVDEGVDPNHIAFIGPDGKSRVKFLTCYDGTSDKYGYPKYDLYGEDIWDYDDAGNPFYYPTADRFTTDATTAYHGTHTMNILAGGYKGNEYYGAAPDAVIAASCGYLADACIADGINNILDYAAYRKEETGMPSVLSLSLGSTAGAHNPDGLMNRFLEECGKETIVVIASGNEGDLKLALNKNMAPGDTTVATMIYPYEYRFDSSAPASNNNTYIRQGAVMIYSADDTPFTIRGFVMTGEPGNYRRRANLVISGVTGNYYASHQAYADYVGGVVNSTIGKYFDGYMGGGSMYDEDLGRYYGVFDYYLSTNPETGINADGSEGAIIGFEVIGADGQRIECYGDGMNTWMYNYGMEGYADGQRDGTISDMAVGRNVIVVGAYTLRDRWTSLDGTVFGYDDPDVFTINDMGHYTSYGTMPDGTTLPHVCAPGSSVISAVSRPYVEASFDDNTLAINRRFQAKASDGGKDYYWVAETGTSMSTPLVAGSIALWLEADPSLTYEETLDIIKTTARKDDFVKAGIQAQWGAGKFDALAGLKEVIKRRAGIKGVCDGLNDRLILTSTGKGTFDVFVGEAARLDLKVYSMDGSAVYALGATGCETSIDLSALNSGIYIINVNGHSKKIRL